MKVLTEARAIEIIREEWNQRLQRLKEDADVHLKAAGPLKGHSIISVDTEVKHVPTGLVMSVKKILDGGHAFVLAKSDGVLLRVSRAELEGKDFVLP